MNGTKTIPKELMDSLVLSIASFMNKTGMTPDEIDASFRAAVDGLSRNSERRQTRHKGGSQIGCDTIAGAVLRAWHRDPTYLDDFANPIPLPSSGSRKSLSTLVKSQDGNADVPSLVSAMQRTGLIMKVDDRRYVPRTNAATISQMHPLAVDHVVKTVLRLVETVTRNMRLVDSKHSLVERYAHIPDLDAKEAQAFSEFSRQQGAACLEAIEDWLEARRKGIRRSSSGKRGSISAGMHVFAYLEETTGNDAVRRVSRKKTATSPRATPV